MSIQPTFFSSRVSTGVLGGAWGMLGSLQLCKGGRGSSGRPPHKSARERADAISDLLSLPLLHVRVQGYVLCACAKAELASLLIANLGEGGMESAGVHIQKLRAET